MEPRGRKKRRPRRSFISEFKALASESRQQLMLEFAGNIELTVGQAAERLCIVQSNASEQLSTLRQGGLLTARRDGKPVYYRTNPVGIATALIELQAHLATCCPPTEQNDARHRT